MQEHLSLYQYTHVCCKTTFNLVLNYNTLEYRETFPVSEEKHAITWNIILHTCILKNQRTIILVVYKDYVFIVEHKKLETDFMNGKTSGAGL